MKQDILNTYEKVSLEYGYNSNSLHKLGLDARKLEETSSNQILSILGLDDYEVIYTSGNAESYTMLANNVKKDVYTDNDEFKDICLEKNIPIVDKNSISKNTFVSLKNVNGFTEKVNHLDLDLNKSYLDLNKYDFITIEDEIPFFGVLIKRRNINIGNLVHGGKSTTKYRSGTSVTPLIASFAKLVRLKYKR